MVFSNNIEFKEIDRGFLSGKCKYSVIGRGIQDTIEESCASNPQGYNMLSSDNFCALIFPDHNPLSLYTDVRGTLVVINAGGCTLRNYNGASKGKTSKLGSGVCNKIKKKIVEDLQKNEEYWRKWKINYKRQMQGLPPAEIIINPLQNQPPTKSLYGEGQSTDNTGLPPAESIVNPLLNQPPTQSLYAEGQSTDKTGSNKDYFKSAHFNKKDNGECLITIVLEGRGVMDSFTTACSTIGDAQMVTSKQGMVIGNPDKDAFSLFSDQWGVVVVVKDGKCTKKTYSSDSGNMLATPEDMDDAECAAVKKKMAEERKSFTNYWWSKVANIKQQFEDLFSFKLW